MELKNWKGYVPGTSYLNYLLNEDINPVSFIGEIGHMAYAFSSALVFSGLIAFSEPKIFPERVRHRELQTQAVSYADLEQSGDISLEEATDLYKRAGLNPDTIKIEELPLRLSNSQLEEAVKSYETQPKTSK